jgi:dipeptidyl aminopeptidase/acylaminoacyl peptidase
MQRLLVAAALWLAAFGGLSGRALAAPSPVAAYGRLPALEEVTLSPSGARMAMIVDDERGRRLVIAALPGGLLAEFPVSKTKIRGIRWAGEDHLLVTSSETHDFGSEFGFKHEIDQVLVVDLAHGKAFFVFATGPVANMAQGQFGVAQVGGRWFAYFGGTPTGRDDMAMTYEPNLYKVDLDTGEPEKVADGSGSNGGWIVGPDGKVLANAQFQTDIGRWSLYGGTGRGKALYETDDLAFGGVLVGPGRAPGSFIYETMDGNDVVHYRESKGADAGEDLFAGQPVKGVLRDPATRLAIGASLEGDDPGLTFFDPMAQKRMDSVRKPFAGRRVEIKSYSADFHRVVVFTTGPGDSGTYWLIDGAKASQIGFAYPDVADADVGVVKMVTYKAADGLELHGVLTLPPGRDPRTLPLVVLPHGGPWDTRDYTDFNWEAQAFAARGFAVFQPNFRGSGGYGAKFEAAAYGEWGRKMQTDVSDGVADLARQGIIDPKRVCIVGGSYGGYVALAGVTVQHGIYRCASSWGGVSNPQGMLRRSAQDGAGNAQTRYLKAFMGAKDAINDSRLNEVSPLALAARADAPILLIYGKDDTVVPIQQSKDMAKALKAAGKPYQVLELPEDHWLSTSGARTAMLQAEVAFVLKNNPPD